MTWSMELLDFVGKFFIKYSGLLVVFLTAEFAKIQKIFQYCIGTPHARDTMEQLFDMLSFVPTTKKSYG